MKENIKSTASTMKNITNSFIASDKHQKKVDKLYKKIKKIIIKASLKGKDSIFIPCPMFMSTSVFKLVAIKLIDEGFYIGYVDRIFPFDNSIFIGWY